MYSGMLGHKDAAMTLNVYVSPFEDDLDDVSNRLDAALLEAAVAVCGSHPFGGDDRTA